MLLMSIIVIAAIVSHSFTLVIVSVWHVYKLLYLLNTQHFVFLDLTLSCGDC